MPALTITAANIIPVSGYSVENGYLAGVSITRGQSVYLDVSATTWKLADSNVSAATAGSGGIGIALNDAGAGQPIAVQIGGSLGFGAILTKGKLYCPGATAGTIVPYEDLTSSDYVTILGIASSTSNLSMTRWVTGVTIT